MSYVEYSGPVEEKPPDDLSIVRDVLHEYGIREHREALDRIASRLSKLEALATEVRVWADRNGSYRASDGEMSVAIGYHDKELREALATLDSKETEELTEETEVHRVIATPLAPDEWGP